MAKVTIWWWERGGSEENMETESFIHPNPDAARVAFDFGFYYTSGHVDGTFSENYAGNFGEPLDVNIPAVQNAVESIVREGNLKHKPDAVKYSYRFDFSMGG